MLPVTGMIDVDNNAAMLFYCLLCTTLFYPILSSIMFFLLFCVLNRALFVTAVCILSSIVMP